MKTNLIRKAVSVLLHPKREFRILDKRALEDVLGEYLKMVLLVGLASGVFTFLITVLKAFYFDLLLDANVQYLRMVNYSFGQVISIVFLYFFVGTFGIFLLSVLLKILFRVKYTRLLKLIFYSMTPVLVFGWVHIFLPGLFVWAAMLFIIGMRSSRYYVKIKKDSIAQRD